MPYEPFRAKLAGASAFISVYIYNIKCRCPFGHRDARKGIGVRQVLMLNTTQTLFNDDALAGIAKPARASVSNFIYIYIH